MVGILWKQVNKIKNELNNCIVQFRDFVSIDNIILANIDTSIDSNVVDNIVEDNIGDYENIEDDEDDMGDFVDAFLSTWNTEINT